MVNLGQNSSICLERCWEAAEAKRLQLHVQVEGAANHRSSWEKDALGPAGSPLAGWDKGGGRMWKYHLVLHLATYFSSDFKDGLNPLVVRPALKRGLTSCLCSGSQQLWSRAGQRAMLWGEAVPVVRAP